MSTADIVQVRDFCGLGFHRNPWGACVPNGVLYGYIAPVVVAPPVAVAPCVVIPTDITITLPTTAASPLHNLQIQRERRRTDTAAMVASNPRLTLS
ncbi:GCG_CRPN prefix-to-repeats domain-containing protein [Bradyrhizobium rifense]|uniref:GCG_CRPN prefix-to-repeats domain-containing protein n=1 Tax=Bradyrhizobium rifense TaxID=515499 RepID=UPI003D31BA52